jgi:hypothetical protein
MQGRHYRDPSGATLRRRPKLKKEQLARGIWRRVALAVKQWLLSTSFAAPKPKSRAHRAWRVGYARLSVRR